MQCMWIKSQDGTKLKQYVSFEYKETKFDRFELYGLANINSITMERLGAYTSKEYIDEIMRHIETHVNMMNEGMLTSPEVAVDIYGLDTMIDKFNTVYVLPQNSDIKDYLEIKKEKKRG